MPLKQTFLERTPQVPEQVLDKLEQLLRTKIDLKTGYAEPHALSRCMFHMLKTIDTSDDQVMTRDSFQVIMNKLNCGEDKLACAALFYRYDRRGTGRVSLKEFADGLFGLLPISGSDAECRDIISIIRQGLQTRGESGFRGLSRALHVADKSGCKLLTAKELSAGFASYGVAVTPYELNTLVFYFDKDKNGKVSIDEVMIGIRPKISDARLALVKLAYLRLDKNPDGLVTLGALKRMFIPEKNPSVLRGEKLLEEVEREFNASWFHRDSDIVTEKDFIDYYHDLSSCIDNDSYFELMVRNAWNISGTQGSAIPTGTIRLLVTHMDGSSTIENLDADLGIDTSSPQSLTNALRKQGVSDILKAELALYR